MPPLDIRSGFTTGHGTLPPPLSPTSRPERSLNIGIDIDGVQNSGARLVQRLIRCNSLVGGQVETKRQRREVSV